MSHTLTFLFLVIFLTLQPTMYFTAPHEYQRVKDVKNLKSDREDYFKGKQNQLVYYKVSKNMQN